MKIYTIAVAAFVICYCTVSSYASKQCDITLWHMAVMEHLLVQDSEMTERQKSILVKVEQLIDRVIKDGGAPLVNCALLNTYSYILAPGVSSQLIDLVIKDSAKEASGDVSASNDQVSHKAEASGTNVKKESQNQSSASNEDIDFNIEDDQNDVIDDINMLKENEMSSSENAIQEEDATDINDKHLTGDSKNAGVVDIYDNKDDKDVLDNSKGDDTNTDYDQDVSVNSDVTEDLHTDTNRDDVNTNSDKDGVDANSDKVNVDANSDKVTVDANSDKVTVDANSDKVNVDANRDKDGADANRDKDGADANSDKDGADAANSDKVNVDANSDKDGADANSDKVNVDANSDKDGADAANSDKDDMHDDKDMDSVVTIDNTDINRDRIGLDAEANTDDRDENYSYDDSNDVEDCYYRSADEYICERVSKTYSSHHPVHDSSDTSHGNRRDGDHRDNQNGINLQFVHDNKQENDVQDGREDKDSRNVHYNNDRDGKYSHGVRDDDEINAHFIYDNNNHNDKHRGEVHGDKTDPGDQNTLDIQDDKTDQDWTSNQEIPDENDNDGKNAPNVKNEHADGVETNASDIPDDTEKDNLDVRTDETVEKTSNDAHDNNRDSDDKNNPDINDAKTHRPGESGGEMYDDNIHPEDKNSREVHDDKIDLEDKNSREVHDDKIDLEDKNGGEVHDDKIDPEDKNSPEVHDDKINSENKNGREVHDDKIETEGRSSREVKDDKNDPEDKNGREVHDNNTDGTDELVGDVYNENINSDDTSSRDKIHNVDEDSPKHDVTQEDLDDNTKGSDRNDGIIIFYDDDDEDDDEYATSQQENHKTDTSDTIHEDIDDSSSSENADEINDPGLVMSETDNLLASDRDNNIGRTPDNQDDDSSKQEVDDDNGNVVSSNVDAERSYFAEQIHSDNEKNEISNNDATMSRGAAEMSNSDDEISNGNGDIKLQNYREEDNESNKYYDITNKNTKEESKNNNKKSFSDHKELDASQNREHPNLDMEKIKTMLAERESEQAAKIQSLELMLVKLENKILTQSVSKHSDSHAFVNLENQILKLENELMKLSHNYRKLQEDNDLLKSQQRKSYLELEHIRTSPRKFEYPALADNSTNEMIMQQQSRIGELSRLIQNQSATAKMLHGRSEYLEEQNRKLFHVVMNQTALISSFMNKLHELGEKDLQTKIQAEVFKAELENLKQKYAMQQPVLQENEQKHEIVNEKTVEMYDFARDLSVMEIAPVVSKDLVSNILLIIQESPTAGSPSMERTEAWRCNGMNSTRLCIFNSLIIANCTPFNDIQWKSCKHMQGSLILETYNGNELSPAGVLNYDVNLPQQEQVRTDQTDESQESNNVEDDNDSRSLRKRNNAFENKEMQFLASFVEGNNDEDAADVNDDDGIDLTLGNKSEFEEEKLSTFLLQAEKFDNDDERLVKMSTNSLNDYSELIQAGTTTIDKEDNNDREQNVLNGDHEDSENNRKTSDDDGSENSLKDLTKLDQGIPLPDIEIEQKTGITNTSPPDEAQTPSTTNESSARFPCEPNDKSPECNDQRGKLSIAKSMTESRKSDVNQELNELVEKSSEHRQNEEHSVSGKDGANKAEEKIADGREISERKKAAEEASKTHEALHRKILYNPVYEDRPKDCYELYKRGQERNGLSQIFVSGLNVYVSVYCDMTSGGWTLLLKREDGLIDFYRNYEQYKEGFGAPRGEHYIGNEAVHHLTNQGHYSLKVDLTDWNNTIRHAHYDHFWLDGEEDDFRLHLLGYSGNAGDGLGKHNGMQFSTFDADHDLLKAEMGGSCSKRFHGAGWYYKCYTSNIFGRYYFGGEVPDKRFDGVAWKPWLGPGYSLKTAVLAIRPFGVE